MTEDRFNKPEIKLRLEDFEREIVVRSLTIEDFEALIEMQQLCFPGMLPWGREQIVSQLEVFPEGQQVVEYEGRIVASSASLIVDFGDYNEWHDWKEIADAGFIRNHDPKGDTLYGIEVMVHPDFRGLKLARRLYEARRELARHYNVARCIVGGRIPNYHKYADQLSAREYAEKVRDGQIYDPVLTTQTANGFVLKQLIPNYLPSDEASCGYATFLEWTNLDYVADPRRSFQRVHKVRIAAVQYLMRSISSVDEFEAQCEFFIDAASDFKADFVVFPELMTTQMLSFMGKHKSPQEAARKLAEMTPRYLDFFTQMAIKYNVNIVGGSQFVVEGDHLRNCAYLFHRDGGIDRQYKIHITPSERRWWGATPGDTIEVFDTDRGMVSIQICYDVEFPELTRIAAAKGAQILLVPFNTNDRDGYLRVRTCAQARCIENHVYAVLSGCTGNLPFVDNADVHYAQSGIFTPSDVPFARDGVAAECTPNIETLVVQDVDIEQLRRHRLRGTVQNWNDRRKDIYQVTYQAEGEPPFEA
ncbi:bifunctional GNAT family N-acetyltransferase/carbon-nitrogen hydrolase family protein [Engelhardtia mirabilis]|uniref:(R)-stereoselective amidase n=1 Tax=Engelhardtia mirabilis TaxID=2528011 RepID=A0A518BHF6_9BACT|nr:(R)-stereoselective amidase [Planctomycetes bacterium Pla133]QDV00689.1 (R)-stereoselective amidase [Planctomycetes bacterium Pla86]